MRNLLILGVLALFGAGSACAQGTAPKTEFFVGYEYEHLNPGGRGCHGFDLNLVYNVKDWLGGVGDLGYCKETGLPSGVSGHDFNYMFGPRATECSWHDSKSNTSNPRRCRPARALRKSHSLNTTPCRSGRSNCCKRNRRK